MVLAIRHVQANTRLKLVSEVKGFSSGGTESMKPDSAVAGFGWGDMVDS